MELLKLLDLTNLEGRYLVTERVGNGMGAASAKGIDSKTGAHVFIKYLISPRNPFEAAQFENEARVIKQLSNWPVKVTPGYISDGVMHGGQVRYLITEWVDGLSLSQWMLEKWAGSSINDRLTVLNRIFNAVGHACVAYSHRDLHPGNIILQGDGVVNWGTKQSGPENSNPAVIVVDWGESYSSLLTAYDGAPASSALLEKQIFKARGGSFYGLPPEFFRSAKQIRFADIGGTYDSWAMGLLLYKLLTGNDLLRFRDIGEYATSVFTHELKNLISEGAQELLSIRHAAAPILSGIFLRLMHVNIESRVAVTYASRVLWDVRIENLVLGMPVLEQYLADPWRFQPPQGWKYSSVRDLD